MSRSSAIHLSRIYASPRRGTGPFVIVFRLSGACPLCQAARRLSSYPLFAAVTCFPARVSASLDPSHQMIRRS